MSQQLWELARSRMPDQAFSTLFPARDVERRLNTAEGVEAAIAWCRETGVTKVYVESFRGGLLATEENLLRARDGFANAGLVASGCITTTGMAKSSEVGWKEFPCFTNPRTREQLAEIFARAARIFDEIMIDDFYCTACECAECQRARGDRSWADYRLELMREVSARDLLAPARAANPHVKIIIKYPQWYEQFHERGYDVDRQTEMFDRIWVGTEARDMDHARWGGCATYRPFWLMRWLGQIGGEKCGGGWYDPYGTHEDTYLEQARQTILGGARESLLFCYGSLLRDTGPANVAALRAELPALLDLAAWVKGEAPRGLVSYRPMNAAHGGDEYVFDWLGMIGLPIIPTHQFPAGAKAAFFSAHAAHDQGFSAKLREFLAGGGRAVVTPRAPALASQSGVEVLPLPAAPRDLVSLRAEEITALRKAALAPVGLALEGPPGVSLYLLGDRKLALENFNEEPVEMRLTIPDAAAYRLALTLGRPGAELLPHGGSLRVTVPGRSLVAAEQGEPRGRL